MADEEETIPIEQEDVLIDTAQSLTIAWKSITRKRDDCWRIVISSTVTYTEHYQTITVGIVPIIVVDDFWTDPETLYTKDFTIEYIWREAIHEAVYTNLVADIQADINQYQKETFLESNAAGAISTLNSNVSYNPDWEP